MFKHLQRLIGDRKIVGIEIVSLLCECGAETINKLKVGIREIHIRELYSHEESALFNVLPICSSLELLKFEVLNLQPAILLKFKERSVPKISVVSIEGVNCYSITVFYGP